MISRTLCTISDWLVSYAFSNWIILEKAITQLSRNAENNFARVSEVLLYIIKRQIYFELEIRCLQLQKKVGRKYSKP